MGELVHSDFQTTPVGASLDDFSRQVLQLIAELPSCSEEKLFIVAINRELEGSRDLSLGDLKRLLHECVQQLDARGLLKIQAGGLVITEPGNRLLGLRGSPENAPEPTMEETPASIPETGRAKRQPEPTQARADEDGGKQADNQIIPKPENGPRKAQGKAEAAQEIVAYIRQIIKDHETGRATGKTEPTQARASEDGGSEKSIGNDTAPIPNGGGAAPVIEEEEILDLTTELGGLEIVEDDDHTVVEITETDDDIRPSLDITPSLNDGGAAPVIEEEEILDLTTELGGLEIVEDDDHPVVEVKEVDETLDLGEPEPSALERAVAAFKEEPVPIPPTPQTERVQNTAPPQAKAAGVEASFEDYESAYMLEASGETRQSGRTLTAAAEMTRDIVVASLLLALAAMFVTSWFGGKPSFTTVLIMLALLLVGSAVWGWRDHRR